MEELRRRSIDRSRWNRKLEYKESAKESLQMPRTEEGKWGLREAQRNENQTGRICEAKDGTSC